MKPHRHIGYTVFGQNDALKQKDKSANIVYVMLMQSQKKAFGLEKKSMYLCG